MQLSSENLFLFLKQSLSVVAMRSAQKTAFVSAQWHHWAQWPFQLRQNWSASTALVQDADMFFYCSCCLSAGQKSHSLGKSLHFSPTVCLVYFLTLFVQQLPHWNQKLGWRLWALVSWIFGGMHHLINYKKKDSFKKLTTFKFGKCFTFLNAALYFPA